MCLNIKSLVGAPGGAGREQVSEPELDEGLGGVPLLSPPSYHLHAEMLVRARLPRGWWLRAHPRGTAGVIHGQRARLGRRLLIVFASILK